MSGNWKIKHPDMKPLAIEANRLAPFGTTYTWVPREQNKHADRLANEALDGKRNGVTVAVREQGVPPTEADEPTAGDEPTEGDEPSWVTWRRQVQTTLVLVRHGVTEHTRERRFSGGLQSANPGLSDEGRDQIRATADWLAPLGERIDGVVASPVRRARESGEILAERLGVPMEEEPGFAEMEFGTWDGLTFDEVAATHRPALEQWLGSLEERPGGGESLLMVQERVLAALERLLARHAGRTVVIASHVTPIKVVVAEALQAPLTIQFRMELRPASVTVVTFFTPPAGETLAAGDEQSAQRYASLRQLNMLAPGVDLFDESTRW
jgi:probable phosphoglycerate mutase